MAIRRTFARKALMGVTAVGGTSFAYAAYSDPTFVPRMKRPLTFWAKMFPIYLTYRGTEFKLNWEKPTDKEALKEWLKKKEETFQVLHDEYAPKVLDLFLELRGLYIKVFTKETCKQSLIR